MNDFYIQLTYTHIEAYSHGAKTQAANIGISVIAKHAQFESVLINFILVF